VIIVDRRRVFALVGAGGRSAQQLMANTSAAIVRRGIGIYIAL